MSDFETPGLVSSSSAPPPTQVSAAWAETTAQAAEAAHHPVERGELPHTPTVSLSAIEARVLGSLVEKSFLTPDTYPMTTNAMVTACNQKTNREPVVDYSAVIVDAALIDMRQRNLVRRVHSQGSRSTKHRQTLDEALALNPQQLALLSVLLLRGPQTIGELRLRTERHDVGFDDLDAVEMCLGAMASRSNSLVVQLQRQPGHKEARWQHLLSDPSDAPVEQPAAHATPNQTQTSAPADETATLVQTSPGVEARVVELESEVATLRRQLASLAAQLGESLE